MHLVDYISKWFVSIFGFCKCVIIFRGVFGSYDCFHCDSIIISGSLIGCRLIRCRLKDQILKEKKKQKKWTRFDEVSGIPKKEMRFTVILTLFQSYWVAFVVRCADANTLNILLVEMNFVCISDAPFVRFFYSLILMKGSLIFLCLRSFKKKNKRKWSEKKINFCNKGAIAVVFDGWNFSVNLLSNFKTKKNIKFRKFHRQIDE